MSKTHFKSKNLVVTVLSPDEEYVTCPSSTCCAPPTDTDCIISLLRPGAFDPNATMPVEYLRLLIDELKGKLQAEKQGADLVLRTTDQRVNTEWLSLLNEMFPE